MNQYLLSDAAKRAGVRSYQVAYAISQGLLPEPEWKINHQRVFTDEDVGRIAAYFAARPKRGRPHKNGGEVADKE